MEYVTQRLIQQVCTEFTTRQLDVWQSHSLIRVQAKDYIREMQLRFIVQPGLGETMTRTGQHPLACTP
jgi:hypothetical protein